MLVLNNNKFFRIYNFFNLILVLLNFYRLYTFSVLWYCFFRTLSGNSCLSETGSLDRGKSALERRKKAAEENITSGRVEITRVNTDTIIEQLIKSTNLEPMDETTSCKFLSDYVLSYFFNWLNNSFFRHV